MIPIERIARAIYLIRGEKVMLDNDLAALYGVETRVLNQDLLVVIENPVDPRLPMFAREALSVLMAQLQAVKEAIRTLESKL
ncbi:ORF6N domain-containing protein [uncultured Nitrospira sp.]|uniref:ORF6N domain-containing protein n=1 Tax=uncultured Nitrospira sp. TaxID=157176 RepID=UPI00314062E0